MGVPLCATLKFLSATRFMGQDLPFEPPNTFVADAVGEKRHTAWEEPCLLLFYQCGPTSPSEAVRQIETFYYKTNVPLGGPSVSQCGPYFPAGPRGGTMSPYFLPMWPYFPLEAVRQVETFY